MKAHIALDEETRNKAMTAICNKVMTDVANMLADELHQAPKATMEAVCGIMRDEIKQLVAGEKYVDERECVVAGTIPSASAIAAVSVECVLRISQEVLS